jgi:hypothetical protein
VAGARQGRLVVACAAVAIWLIAAPSARAGYYYVNSCSSYGNTAPAFQPNSSAAHLSPSDECMVWSGTAYRSLEINEVFGSVLKTYGAQWMTETPSPAIMIVNAYTPANAVLVDCNLGGDGFFAVFFWGDGTQWYGSQPITYMNGCSGGVGSGYGISQAITPSRYFGWTVACELKGSCTASTGGALLAVQGVQLEAEENTGPSLMAVGGNNLWYENGWVRGTWPATLSASDPSGVCSLVTYVNGQAIASWSDPSPDPSSWTQCHGSQLPAQIDTTKYSNGPLSLTYSANNAAAVSSFAARGPGNNPVLVDNSPVELSLSGPTDAPVTSGTQYVTATATAGPSGVAGISCSADGAPYSWQAGSSTRIPVAGLGGHQVSCYAENNSIDASGAHAMSARQAWSLSIREPTVSAISFSHLADPLRCRRLRERIEVPARWVTVRRHHRTVRVLRRAHRKTVRVVRCRPRTKREKVTTWVTVKHHGKRVRVKRTKIIRVVVLPHVVARTTRRVRHGRGTTVSGWLGTPSGTPLAGQAVVVLTAPDNGRDQFHQADVVSTVPDGTWVAHLRPGPSRLVEAVYQGTRTAEPAISRQVRVVVPAKVRLLRVSPRRVAWGHTVRITGQLFGGYLPPEGALVRLRIGIGASYTTYGVAEHVTGNGRFTTTYTFGAGDPSIYRTFWFQIASLPMGEYPYAPAASGRIQVVVGGEPIVHRHHYKRRRMQQHHHRTRRLAWSVRPGRTS